jgi:hypothetical protein
MKKQKILSGSIFLIIILFSTSINSVITQDDDDDDYNNYDDSNYSSVPTKEKKYECQKGVFEGFFVSSVELCKNVSVKRGDGNGTVGTQGPKGSEGTAGPQGLSGLNIINGSNLYYNLGNVSTTDSMQSTIGNSVAVCDTDDIAIGGNYNVTRGDSNVIYVVVFDGNLGTDTYNTRIVDPSLESSLSFQTSVLCFDNPPLR